VELLAITYLLLCGGVSLDGLRRHTQWDGHGHCQQGAKV